MSWRDKQQEAERLRDEAKAYLESKGMSSDNSIKNLGGSDNTLELLKKRKLNMKEIPITSTKVAAPYRGRAVEASSMWTVDYLDGKQVYFHAHSGCMTSEAPKIRGHDLSEKVNRKVPRGYKLLKDPVSEETYYWCLATDQLNWDIVEVTFDESEPVEEEKKVSILDPAPSEVIQCAVPICFKINLKNKQKR